MNKTDAIEAIARNIDDLIAKGTVASATATQIDSNALIHPITGQLKGYELWVNSGGGAGQVNIITEFDPTNNRVTFDNAFSPVPSTNASFFIFQRFKKADYDNVINRAMGVCQLVHLNDMVATLQLAGSQYEYLVPSGLDIIHRLRLIPSGHTDYAGDDEVERIFEFRPPLWRIEKNLSGTYCIVFDPRRIDLDDYDEEIIKVMGQTKPSTLGTDNAVLDGDLEEYIIAKGSALLALRKITESVEWQQKFAVFRDMADYLEAYIFTQPRGVPVQ